MTDYSAARAASRERKFPQWMFGGALLVLIALGVVGWLATQQAATITDTGGRSNTAGSGAGPGANRTSCSGSYEPNYGEPDYGERSYGA